MRTIYIGGGQKSKKNGGVKWKIYIFLLLFLAISGSILKVTAPTIVEEWINRKGAGDTGYAFSIRDVDLSFGKRQMTLKDVKIFNPKTNTGLIEAPNLTINLNLLDLKKVSVYADEVDLILSKDFSLEMKNDFYLDTLEGKIGKLNIIEQKEDQSRTVLELNDVSVKVKEFKEFSFSSNVAGGGKLNLTGKGSEIQGSLKQVPAGIFNKIAGDQLPFSFNEPSLNAEISARFDHGKVSGEIAPDIKRLNLLEEKPGIPTQSIARALTDELTFILPFTLQAELTLHYADTYRKLKNYRKDPAPTEDSVSTKAAAPQTPKTKAKKTSSFWPF